MCFSSDALDRDPTAGNYYIIWTFGDLVNASNNMVVSVTHYEVAFVDKYGNMLKQVAMVDAEPNRASCCIKDKYKVSVKFNTSEMREFYPSGYDGTTDAMRLAITARDGPLYLPYFAFSQTIVDKTVGRIKIFKGAFIMKMLPDDARRLTRHKKAKRALGQAYADAIGVNSDDVQIPSIWIEDERVARRLGSENFTLHDKKRKKDVTYVYRGDSAANRRLMCCPTTIMICGGNACPVAVKANFVVSTTNMNQVIDRTTNKFLAILKANLLKEVAAIGVAITITETVIEHPPTTSTAGSLGFVQKETTTVPPAVRKTTGGASTFFSFPWISVMVAACSFLAF